MRTEAPAVKTKTKKITSTKEDYVRAIYILSQSNKNTVTQIAERLVLSKSTVSERIKELIRDGLVLPETNTEVGLTKKGLDVGEKLTYKHRVIEVFLHQTLKMKKDLVHAEAERLEHGCSDEVIKRLAKFLHNPTKDPHGSKIPQIKNWNLNKN